MTGGVLVLLAWTHSPLQLPFALLLHLQLVVQLLLQPLLGELDLPDGALVLQPPLASCRSNTLAVTAQLVSQRISQSSDQFARWPDSTRCLSVGGLTGRVADLR